MLARPILVLGAERSGATLVTELIGRWGAHRGGADEQAGRGFMNELLAAAGGALWSPTLAARLAELAEEPEWRERGLALDAAMACDRRPWLWEAPFAPPLVAFWERLLRAPIFVFVVRNPLDCAPSFARACLPGSIARQLRLAAYFGFRWQVSNLVLLELSERHPDHLFVDYEQVLKAPFEQVRRLGSFLDGATGAAKACDERLLPMLEGVDPGLWHHKSGSRFFELTQVIEEQKELLRYLRRRAAGAAEAFAPARFPIPPYAWKYLQNFELYLTEQEKDGAEEAVAAAGGGRQGAAGA